MKTGRRRFWVGGAGMTVNCAVKKKGLPVSFSHPATAHCISEQQIESGS